MPSQNYGELKVTISIVFMGSDFNWVLPIASSYKSSRNEASFLSYFASTTPDSEHKRARLKMILLLAGSTLYDPSQIRARLSEHEKILTFELAIIDGKVNNSDLFVSCYLPLSNLFKFVLAGKTPIGTSNSRSRSSRFDVSWNLLYTWRGYRPTKSRTVDRRWLWPTRLGHCLIWTSTGKSG